MAYQSGIRDANTVRQMNKTVKKFGEALKEMKNRPGNSEQMNRILNKIDRLWGVVKRFYLDIEEGGLPLIVYQTTGKLEENLGNYAVLIDNGIRK